MSVGSARTLFLFFLVINCILWSRGRYGQPIETRSFRGDGSSLVKRISYELTLSQESRIQFKEDHEHECQPLAFPISSQCKHVDADCPSSDTLLSIDYLHKYFCADAALRPLVFVGLLTWLVFLFSTLGISASDFFTPNLATIAQQLGLDENVAGVTFLAFGNGSPDLFSTFSAMRANSGSLAVGELLGAATFIVSCVVGSMCVIKPFEVHRASFLRDVGFFGLAVSLVLIILWDGKITRLEAGALVGLYLIYAFVVVAGSWWINRRERQRLREALERDEYAEPFPPYTDEPTQPTLTLSPPTPGRSRAISTPNPPRLQTNLPPRHYSRSPSPVPSHITQLPSFSLVGAIEFRDVVASLKKQAAGNSLGLFESPVTPYAGGHYHARFPRSGQTSLSSSMDEETLNGLQLGDRGRIRLSSSSPTIHNDHRPSRDDYFGDAHPPVPSILRTPASPAVSASDLDSEEQLYTPLTRSQRIWAGFRRALHLVFPTLHNFREQSIVGKIACIFATPAVLALTLTLPVVMTPYVNPRASPEKLYNGDARLVDFEEEGMERVLIAEEEVEENLHDLEFSKWLCATQCILGPSFCAQVLFGNNANALWILLGTILAGIAVGVFVLVYSDKGDSPAARMARCSMGFFVAMIWIMAIADEVVNVLQTFGFIFGLSDAIIGLTIFAVGNSLADLVANMSVAVFAPIMGFSACFGGPMLNILLGVGLSGSYIIHQTSEPYSLQLSKTLFVSCFGLLFLLTATVIFVPLNGYFLSKRWGVLLITTYILIMVINIIVEITG